MATVPALAEPLSDGVITLRRISDWDIPDILIAFQDDPEMAAGLGLARAPSGADLGSEVERSDASWEAGRPQLTLTRAGSDDCIGRLEIDLAARACQIWVSPGQRGRGYARRALALAGDWLGAGAGCQQLQCGQDRPRGG
ncbi:MAG: hypothetical protein J2O48_06105, partial [Solirubrobacterales bacterium]|nr:hypothetical protein [Solirubrobacterales bacterium]